MDNLMSIVENAIQTGLPVLLQDVMEEIDPSLEPVLTKAFVVRSGKVCHSNPCQNLHKTYLSILYLQPSRISFFTQL
jgi:hypothetical protein